MVKSPKIRHSKSLAEPVTIELGASDVSRIEPESAADAKSAKPEAAAADKAAAEARAKAETGRTVSEKPTARLESAAAKPSESKPAAGQPTPPVGSGQFGRDASAKTATPPPPPPPRKDAPPLPHADAPLPRRGSAPVFAAGILGALIALVAAGGAAWYAGLLLPKTVPAADTGQVGALRSEIDALRSSVAELANQPPAQAGGTAADAAARLDSLGTLVEDLRRQVAQLEEAAGSAGGAPDGAALDELRAGLAALQQRVESLPAGGGGPELKADIARVEEAARNAAETASSASNAATQAATRLDALEKSVAALSAEVEEQGETPDVALAIAASALKAAIDRGTPFQTELDTYRSLAPDTPEIAALAQMAAAGVPTRAELSRVVDAAADAMIAAGRPADPNADFLDRLWASAQSLIQVRPVGEVEGTGVPATVARIEVAVNAGAYDKALAEYETLPAQAKAAGADFMAKVRARQSADQLVDKALAAALRA